MREDEFDVGISKRSTPRSVRACGPGPDCRRICCVRWIRNADRPADNTDDIGGATDLWSELLSQTDVTDVDFGFFVSMLLGGTVTTEFQVDFMQMKVHYSPPPIVLAYVYDDNGAQLYGEKVLIAGAVGLLEPSLLRSFAILRSTNY